MRSRTGVSAVNRRKFVKKATQAPSQPTTSTQPVAQPAAQPAQQSSSTVVQGSNKISAAGIVVAAPGAQDRVDGKTVESSNLYGGDIKVDEEGRMDLSEIEKMGVFTAGARGTVVPTEQFVGIAKDVVYGVETQNQKTMESGLDLVINPLIKPFMDPKMRSEGVITDQWYWPEELKADWKVLPEFMQKGGEGKPPETRSFVEGMSGVVGNIGAIVQSPIAHKIAQEEAGVSLERFTRSPSTTAYYIGSAIGEIPYFIIGAGQIKAVATISAKATAGVMKGTVRGTSGLALVARTYKIERAYEAAARSTVKSNISASKTGTITGKSSILKAVNQLKDGYRDNIIKQSDKTIKLPEPQRQIADELIDKAKIDSGLLGNRFSGKRIDRINNMPTSNAAERIEKVRVAQEFVGEVETILLPQLKTFKTTYLGLTSSMIKGGKIERLANVIQGSPVDVKTKLDKFLNPPGRTQGDMLKTADEITTDNVFRQTIHDTVEKKWKAGDYEGVLGNIKINKDLFGNVVSSALGVNKAREKAKDIATRFSKAIPVITIIPGDSAARAFQLVDDKMTALKTEKTQLEAAKKGALEYAKDKTVDTPEGILPAAYASDNMSSNIINNEVKINKLQQSVDSFKNQYDTKVSANRKKIKTLDEIISTGKFKAKQVDGSETLLKADKQKITETKSMIEGMKSEITDWTERFKTNTGYNKSLKEIKELKSQNITWKKDSKKTVPFRQEDPNMMTVDNLTARIAAVDFQISKVPKDLRNRVFHKLSWTESYAEDGGKLNRGDPNKEWRGATSEGYNPDFERGTMWRMDVFELNRMFPGFGDTVASQTIHVAVKPAVGIRKENGIWRGTWGGDRKKLDLTPEQRETLGLKDGEDRIINDPGGDIWIVNDSRKKLLETFDAKDLPPSQKRKKIGLKRVKLPLIGTVKTLIPWKADEKVSMVYMMQGGDVLKASSGADPKSGVRPLIQFAANTPADKLELFKSMGYYKIADDLPPTAKVAFGGRVTLEYRGLASDQLNKVIGPEALIENDKARLDWRKTLSAAMRAGNENVDSSGRYGKESYLNEPPKLEMIQVDGGQGFSKRNVPIIDILKQRALVEGNIDSVIGYAKDKDVMLQDELSYLHFQKSKAEQATGGWTDTSAISVEKMKAKIKNDLFEIEEKITNVKRDKESNLKWADKDYFKDMTMKDQGIHLGATRQGTFSYMSEYKMDQFASQYDAGATPGNFVIDKKTGQHYFSTKLPTKYTTKGEEIKQTGYFRILDPENYDSSMTTSSRKVPVDSMSEGGVRVSQMRNSLVNVTGDKSPYVMPITGAKMGETTGGKSMYQDMPGIAPAYNNRDDMHVWTSSGKLSDTRLDFKMTESDRSEFSRIMGTELDVELRVGRKEYEGIDPKLTRRLVSLDDPDSYKGILQMVDEDEVGRMQYGKGWKFVKEQQSRLESADQSATGSGVWNAIKFQKQNLNVNIVKRIGGKLENINERKNTISEFFMGERFEKVDMRNLNPSEGLGSMEQVDFIEGMLGMGDGVRHAGYDYFTLSKIMGVSKEQGAVKQGVPVGGFVSHPMAEMQDLSHITKEKVMSDPPRDPTKADKRTNYKILEDEVIRNSGLEPNMKNENFMQFKRNMVKLVYKKIHGTEIKSSQVNKIVRSKSRYKKTVLDELDTPGNNKLRYPKFGERTFNKLDKGFIHPGVDLPTEYRNTIPKKEGFGKKTWRQFDEQMTPVRPEFGGAFEPGNLNLGFSPGKVPHGLNLFLRRMNAKRTPVTAEAPSSNYNTALLNVLSELEAIDPKLLGKKNTKQLEALRSHQNIGWDKSIQGLEEWQKKQVADRVKKRDNAQKKLDDIPTAIENKRSDLLRQANLKGVNRISVEEVSTQLKLTKAQYDTKSIKLEQEISKYNAEGRELREGYQAANTPYVTADYTIVSTTEGGVRGFKWLTQGDGKDLIIQPASKKLGKEGKDVSPPPLNYDDTKSLVRAMVYKSLGITEDTFSRAKDSNIRGINREINWNLQEGFSKSQAKRNTRSPKDFANWLKSLDTTGDKNTPKLGDTSRDVVESLRFKKLTDAKSSATENLQKMDEPNNMAKEKYNFASSSMSAPRIDKRIYDEMAKRKEVGLVSQLKLGLRSAPLVTTTQTEGFGLLPGANAEPMMMGPEPKNIVEQTISEMQSTMTGIEKGSNKIGDTGGQLVKTYTAPTSLTEISSSVSTVGGLASMSTIDTSSAQVPGFMMDITSGLKLDTDTGQNIVPVFMRFLKTPQEQVQRQVQQFVTPQLYPVKPLLIQATQQIPPITKPPITNIFPIAPIIPKFPTQGGPIKYTRERKRVRHKKTWWQTPENWYEPYYWGGKNQEGVGYVTFKGREPGKVRKYEKKHFGIGVGDTAFGIKGNWF